MPSSIAIVQFHDRIESDPNLVALQKVTVAYCLSHGYAYHFETQSTISPYWAKVQVVLKYLSKYDWVIWVDSDAVIRDTSVDLASFLGQYAAYDFVGCSDPPIWTSPFMAGVFCVRNTPLMQQLFKVWFSLYDPKKWSRTVEGKWKCLGPWAGVDYEQGAFVIKILPDPRFKSKILLLSYDYFHVYDLCQTTRQTIFYHFAGNFKKNIWQYIQPEEFKYWKRRKVMTRCILGLLIVSTLTGVAFYYGHKRASNQCLIKK